MKLSNVFELKARSQEQSVYTQMMELRGHSPRYSDVNYRTIAKEGYMRNWIMFRCLQEIMRAAVQLNWKVMKYNNNGEVEEVKNHPIVQILEKPNPIYGQAELIKRLIAFYYIGGEAPIHKITTSTGEAKELYTYRPDRVSFTSTGRPEDPYSEIKYNGGTPIDILSSNFLLWKNFNPLDEFDGLGHGMSMLEPILKNGDLLNEMTNWNVSLMQNGGNLSGVIAVEETLGDNEYERATEQLKNKHQGSANVGKYLLLEGGAKYYSTGVNPKDMDWTNGKNSVMMDICIGMGVDPILIGFNENSSYNNKNEAEKGLYTKVAIPLMRELADQLNEFLKVGENEYIDIDYSHIPVLQKDMKEMAEILAKAKDMTINEKRSKRGLEPIEGGDIIAPEGSFAIVDGRIYLPMNLVDINETQPLPQAEGKSEDFLY